MKRDKARRRGAAAGGTSAVAAAAPRFAGAGVMRARPRCQHRWNKHHRSLQAQLNWRERNKLAKAGKLGRLISHLDALFRHRQNAVRYPFSNGKHKLCVQPLQGHQQAPDDSTQRLGDSLQLLFHSATLQSGMLNNVWVPGSRCQLERWRHGGPKRDRN